MAVSSVSSSTSIYGSRNVLSGLASGLDTEQLIENAIKGYQSKISALQQKRTKTEWKQDAYRSIIDKMSVFSDKYTSYKSSTNLMSTSFFDQAVQTVSQGENASKVTASGRTSSNVEINRVLQLAKASTYRLGGSQIGNKKNTVATDGLAAAVGTSPFVLQDKMNVSAISGSMTLAYGGEDARTNLSLSFKDGQVFSDATALADEINKQLAEQTVTFSSGSSKKASELLEAKTDGLGRIYFDDKAGNGVYISSASENIQNTILAGQEPGEDTKILLATPGNLKKEVDPYEYLAESPLTITLDGVTKNIDMPTKEDVENYIAEAKKEDASKNVSKEEAYAALLQKKITEKFGTTSKGDPKLKAELVDATDENGNVQKKLQFKAGQEASTFTVRSDKGWAMGFGEEGSLTSYLNTNSELKDLVNLSDDMKVKKVVKDSSGNEVKDANGNPVYEKDAQGNFVYEKDDDGNDLYSLKINGVEIGRYTEDTSLGTIINNINSNAKVGFSASYSKTTNELTFTAKNTGATEKIEFGEKGSLADALFGSNQVTKADGTVEWVAKDAKIQAGQDAIFEVSINGGDPMEVTRSSNSVDFDGLTVNLKGTFGYEAVKDADGNVTGYDKVDTEAVSFKTNADADKIVNAIKAMVDDYNTMVTEIKNAYSTLPQQRTSGAYYEPLTDEDKEGMSDSAIEAWEDKAKTGLLFGDTDLSQLYKRLTSAVSMYGQNGADLKAAGITLNYSNGLTTLNFDEQTLRNTLESDPDKVRDIFTKSDGLMQAVKTPLDQYGKTTGGKGILVDKAGSVLAPSTLYTNRIYKELTSIDEEIEKWEDKMSDRVDYYTTQFTRLEQLVSQMNSQSSYFSQLSGGY